MDDDKQTLIAKLDGNRDYGTRSLDDMVKDVSADVLRISVGSSLPVLRDPNGRPVKGSGQTQQPKRRKRAGSFHTMRHTYVVNTISAGVDMYAVSKRLGHSSVQVTYDLYGHMLPHGREEVALVMDGFLSTPPAEYLEVETGLVEAVPA